jgi:hypothetical protein
MQYALIFFDLQLTLAQMPLVGGSWLPRYIGAIAYAWGNGYTERMVVAGIRREHTCYTGRKCAQGDGLRWPSPCCWGSGALGASQMRQHHRKATTRLQGLRAQVRDYCTLQGQRRKLFPRAFLVGLLAGAIAVAFRWALVGGDLLRNRLLVWSHQAPTWGWLLPMVVGALGAGLAVVLVHRVAPEAAGSGIPHVKAVLYWLRSMRWQAILLVKFVGGVVGIGSGLALGREGPTVQLGSALGTGVLVKRGQLTRPSFGVPRTFGASRLPGSLPMAEVPRCPQAQSLALGMCPLLPPS